MSMSLLESRPSLKHRPALRGADFNQKIDAAETLCVVGERQLGIRTLNQIIKTPGLNFDIRLKAAQSLKDVNETAAAAKAYKLMRPRSSGEEES